jgi:hypothetical protein
MNQYPPPYGVKTEKINRIGNSIGKVLLLVGFATLTCLPTSFAQEFREGARHRDRDTRRQ